MATRTKLKPLAGLAVTATVATVTAAMRTAYYKDYTDKKDYKLKKDINEAKAES